MIRNIIYQVLQGLAFIHKHGKGGIQIGKSVQFSLAITLIINDLFLRSVLIYTRSPIKLQLPSSTCQFDMLQL